nr:hypothetical protein [Ancylobacter sonchi]
MKELAVIALDHAPRILHERDDGVAQGGCLPGRCRDPSLTEQAGGDLTIGRARTATVPRLKHVAQATALLECDPPVWRHGRSLHMGPEPYQSLDTIRQMRVHPDEGTEGWIEAMAFWQHNGDRVAARADYHTAGCMQVMVRVLRCITSGQAATGGVALRDKHDEARVGFQVPDDRNGSGITCGIDREIVDPSGLA